MKNFVGFFGGYEKTRFAFEIYWPLDNTNVQFYFMIFLFYFFQVTTNPIPAILLPQQPHPPSAVLHQQNLSHAHPTTVTKSESNSIIIVKSCQTWTGFSRQFLTIFGKIIDALFWEETVIILLEFSSCTLAGFSKKKHNQKNCKKLSF